MKKQLLMILAVLLAVALAGCNQNTSQAEGDGHDHAGHDHGRHATANKSAATCAAHNALKELCFICDASLREPGRLWCAEHGCYEDRCWKCHPELQDNNRLWCAEHSLYEDECFLCRPELKTGSKPVASKKVLMCGEHGVPEAECAICRPDATAALKPGESLKVRLPSTNSAAIVGVQTARPESGAMADGVECLAEVSFNLNKLAQVAVPVGGIVQSVEVDLGDQVTEAQTLAKLWSASIAEAVAKAVLTHQTLDRERKLRAGRVTSEQDLQEAEAAHSSACQQLRTLGFTEEQIEELSGKPQEQVLMEVRAPFAGEITDRTAVRGSLVEAGKPLFTVVDRSVMWAVLQVPESVLALVKTGQTVELRVDSLPGQVFTGKLTWIAPAVDDRTRMARARAEFANPDGLLKDKMFATARILTRQSQASLLVPPAAIQRVEGKPFVFVKLDEDLFDARAVTLGAQFGGKQEILSGLQPQEEVAVNHAFALKSAMLMSRLGAGCADD